MVELMVGAVIALVIAVIVMQALAFFEGQKRTTTGGSDSAINGALALYQVEREARMTGFGLTSPTGMLCPLGVNIYYNGTTVSNGAALAPILITDGASGAPDQIRFARSQSTYGISPTPLVAAMASPSAAVRGRTAVGIVGNDLFMVGAADGSKICTLMQASATPVVAGTGYDIVHATTKLYNPANPASVFNSAPSYVVGDTVVAMGNFGLSTYQVLCNDDAAPSATNSCDLVQYDPITAGATINWANANLNHVASQIIDMQAQYGVAPDGSDTVNQWVNAKLCPITGTPPGWVEGVNCIPLTVATMLRIKAIRVALVARSSTYDPATVSPATLLLWDASLGGVGSAKSTTLSAAQQHYRYKVYYMVIPLMNMVWANV